MGPPKQFSGSWDKFPPMKDWISFDDMWNRNLRFINMSKNTSEDTRRIKVAIEECAKIGVDERVILAIIMQESHGDVGVRTTYSPGDNIPTGGLMQCGGCAGAPGRNNLSQVGSDETNSH